MEEQDVRWKQRLANYQKALGQLKNAVSLANERALSDLEQQGIIQAFEFTHELAWNVMKDYFFYQGNPEIRGSRDATREAFRTGLVEDGEGWMAMISSRNKTSHTYNEDTADEIVQYIIDNYYNLFQEFSEKMTDML